MGVPHLFTNHKKKNFSFSFLTARRGYPHTLPFLFSISFSNQLSQHPLLLSTTTYIVSTSMSSG